MNIIGLMKHIRKNKLSKIHFEPNEFDKLEMEMSTLIKSKDPELWGESSDNILATLASRDVPEENFMCMGIPIICKTI